MLKKIAFVIVNKKGNILRFFFLIFSFNFRYTDSVHFWWFRFVHGLTWFGFH